MRNYIVAETIDGQVVKTYLEREQAQRLYRKIRAAGGVADIYEDFADNYMVDLFIIGDVDISHRKTASIFRGEQKIDIEDIEHDIGGILDAIKKVKFEGWSLCPF